MPNNSTQRLSDELDKALKSPIPDFDEYAHGMPVDAFSDMPPVHAPATGPKKSASIPAPEPETHDSQRYCVRCMFCRVRTEERGWFKQPSKTAICTLWRDLVRAEPLTCVEVRASAAMCGELGFSYQPARRGAR